MSLRSPTACWRTISTSCHNGFSEVVAHDEVDDGIKNGMDHWEQKEDDPDNVDVFVVQP